MRAFHDRVFPRPDSTEIIYTGDNFDAVYSFLCHFFEYVFHVCNNTGQSFTITDGRGCKMQFDKGDRLRWNEEDCSLSIKHIRIKS